MQSAYLLKKSNASMDCSMSESKVYAKHRELTKLRKAFVPNSTRRKLMGSSYFHARLDGRFDRLYNTSPHRKIQKLREARNYKPQSVLQRSSRSNRSIIRENNSDLVAQACDKCLDTGEAKKIIEEIDCFYRVAKDRALSMLQKSENSDTLREKKRKERRNAYISICSKLTTRKKRHNIS